MASVTFVFEVNGTDKNSWAELYGLRFNPIPQHGKYELNGADLMFQSLAEPIKSADDIRQRMKGADSELVEHVIKDFYKPGQLIKVKLKLSWPDKPNKEKRHERA